MGFLYEISQEMVMQVNRGFLDGNNCLGVKGSNENNCLVLKEVMEKQLSFVEIWLVDKDRGF